MPAGEFWNRYIAGPIRNTWSWPEAVWTGLDEKQQKNLREAIKLNLINRKEYPFEVLQRKYGLPCSQKLFRKESRKFIRIFSGLCGFE